jgi:hypothetical protein
VARQLLRGDAVEPEPPDALDQRGEGLGLAQGVQLQREERAAQRAPERTDDALRVLERDGRGEVHVQQEPVHGARQRVALQRADGDAVVDEAR